MATNVKAPRAPVRGPRKPPPRKPTPMAPAPMPVRAPAPAPVSKPVTPAPAPVSKPVAPASAPAPMATTSPVNRSSGGPSGGMPGNGNIDTSLIASIPKGGPSNNMPVGGGAMVGGNMRPPVNKSSGGPSGNMSGMAMGATMGSKPVDTTGGMSKSAVMPANGGFIPGAMGGPSKLNSSPGAPSGNMPVGGGAMAIGGGMGSKPVDTTGAGGWKKGGKVKTKCYAKGGSVRTSASSRGDGCATKGHTKGVMR